MKNGLGGKDFRCLESQEQRPKAESPTKSLPQGKLNAVRAAFKAGVTLARIAREFGLSQADVRKALSGHGNKL
jgi:predicted transcriptional regulator